MFALLVVNVVPSHGVLTHLSLFSFYKLFNNLYYERFIYLFIYLFCLNLYFIYNSAAVMSLSIWIGYLKT